MIITPRRVVAALAVLAVLAYVLFALHQIAQEIPALHPDPSPSSPATYAPDECTAEDVAEDGICLTWDDMHSPGVEWQTGQGH